MMGVLFIIIVVLMVVGFTIILIRGRRMVLVDPQPDYYIVEDEEVPVGRRTWYYPPQHRDPAPVYQEMLDTTKELR